jgi:hypothetical protein
MNINLTHVTASIPAENRIADLQDTGLEYYRDLNLFHIDIFIKPGYFYIQVNEQPLINDTEYPLSRL